MAQPPYQWKDPAILNDDSKRSKLPRWHVSKESLAVLEHVFSIEQFPSMVMRQRLAADLSVTPRQVTVGSRGPAPRARLPQSDPRT